MSDKNESQLMQEALATVFKPILKAALRELREEEEIRLASDDTARQLAEINQKVNITVPEACLLLRCSDSYLYNQIKLAQKNKTKHPIPVLNKERLGVYVFPREALIAWAQPVKLSVVEDEEAA